jgi:poly-gamma-glutamate synthesis protein (capsule biosynthesis protein)
MTISFTGDIMMHYAVKGCALNNDPAKKDRYTVEGFNHLFKDVAPLLSAADYTVGNMEFPVSPPFVQNEFIFNCPPEVIPSLKASGYDVVSLANNHIVDQGIKGALDTFGYLEKYGLTYFGVGRDEEKVREGILVEKNGIKVGILTYAGLMNYAFPKSGSGVYVNNLNDKDKVFADIARIRPLCDVLIVQPHSGIEYTLSPTPEQITLYREMIDAGVDMVIGHHPHTLQYAEDYKGKKGNQGTIYYSLGNFICNQNYTYPIPGTKERFDIRSSAVITVTVNKTGSAVTRSVTVTPTHTIHEKVQGKKDRDKEIRTVVVSDEIRKYKEALAKNKNDKIAAKQLEYFRTQLSSIRKVLFRKGMPKDTVFVGD